MTWARNPETPAAASQWFLGSPNFQIFSFTHFYFFHMPKRQAGQEMFKGSAQQVMSEIGDHVPTSQNVP